MQNNHETIENSEKILDNLRALLKKDLLAIDQLLKQELHSQVPLTHEITQHIFQSGGKRLRPLVVILTAKALAPDRSLNVTHYELASVIEFVHTATLLHDDVVDNSNLRRGKKTANAIWDNQASVLVGDFLYSRAFQILSRRNHSDVMRVLSEATNAIAEGEIMQLMNQRDPHLTESNYFHVITQKTAKLFSAAAEIGAILSHATPAQQQAMADYGLHIGIAFQLIDDVLDYQASTNTMGKNAGDDLSEGKTTLPIIYAIQHSDEAQANYIRETVQQGRVERLETVISILHKTNALGITKQKAMEHIACATRALAEVPESSYRNAMQDLLSFAVMRGY